MRFKTFDNKDQASARSVIFVYVALKLSGLLPRYYRKYILWLYIVLSFRAWSQCCTQTSNGCLQMSCRVLNFASAGHFTLNVSKSPFRNCDLNTEVFAFQTLLVITCKHTHSQICVSFYKPHRQLYTTMFRQMFRDSGWGLRHKMPDPQSPRPQLWCHILWHLLVNGT